MKIVDFIKHYFDKKYNDKYNDDSNGTLIRKMFPWIYRIDDKKILSKQLLSLDPDIRKVLNTYYRSEVNILIEAKRYNEIEKYEWIQKLISDLNYLYNNPNEYGRYTDWSLRD